ncbi:Gfo/Idh/MocA family protein [Yoonia sp. 208BN28-4]|uniref:Gfo/Idh/MocA family protein n=1 Tax=Yoonia sp. 208BN28-4 TaxID=3126505 RepID=UPI0030A0F0E3
MTLRVACVGAGYFARFHYDSWARMARATCVAACDHDLSKARATRLPAYDDLAQMLADQTPDILDIILPPDGHRAAITTALQAGVQTLICQKPFGTSLVEAQQLTTLAEDAGATLVIHENFRFMPWYRAMKADIDAGLIGEVHQITFRLRPGDGQGPDAYLDRQPYFQSMPQLLIHETGVHWVDTFRYLLGDPTAVYADLRRMNPAIQGEDAGFVIFDFANGTRGLFDGNRLLDHAADNKRRTMGEAMIEGTAGTLTLYGDGLVTFRAFGALAEETRLPPDTHDGFGGDCVHHLQSHVVAGLLDGTPLENMARDYLKVREIEDAIYRSDAEGRKITL